MTDGENELLKWKIERLKKFWWIELKVLEGELETRCKSNNGEISTKVRLLLGKVDRVWMSVLRVVIQRTR